eukprot:scaffold142485_cov33-Tisochrysis_lutea.AAC.1
MEHRDNSSCAEQKSHVRLAAQVGAEAAVVLLERGDEGEHTLGVHAGQVIAQRQKHGERSIRHREVRAIIL